MSNNVKTPPNNGAVFTISQIIKAVMSLAAEAKFGALYINFQEAVPAWHLLKFMGHKQPPTPMQTNNNGLFPWTALFGRLAVQTISLQLCKQNKRSILIFRSISYLGIVLVYPRLPYNHHPKLTTTMVSRLPLWLHGCGKSANPTPGSLYKRGCLRLWWKDLPQTYYWVEKILNL